MVEKKYDDGLSSSKILIEPIFKVNFEYIKKNTKPPAYYNSASLLKCMKTNGIGTKSTRATIIEGLVKNLYLSYCKYELIITGKGEYLCNYWKYKWPSIVSPSLTKDIEKLFPINSDIEVQKYYEKYKLLLKDLIVSNKI